MRGIIFLAGCVMATSWGLVWLEPPFAGPDVSPMALMREGVVSIGPDASWQAWVFVGGFIAAALAALLALIGRGASIFALLAGMSPLVVGVSAYLRAEEVQRDLNLPFEVDFGDVAQAWELLQDFLRAGVWAYLGGAAILLVAAMSILFAPRR